MEFHKEKWIECVKITTRIVDRMLWGFHSLFLSSLSFSHYLSLSLFSNFIALYPPSLLCAQAIGKGAYVLRGPKRGSGTTEEEISHPCLCHGRKGGEGTEHVSISLPRRIPKLFRSDPGLPNSICYSEGVGCGG